MRRWIWPVALSAVVMSGCPSESSFECGSDNDCGSDGRCEPTGFCSFPDATCASGFRYGDLAESLSNQCVIEEGTTTESPSTTTDESTTTSASSSTDTPTTSSMTSSGDSSDGSTSTDGESSSTTELEPTGSSSTETGATTGGPECLADEFNVLPSLPAWFVFSNSLVAPSVEDGELLLPIANAADPSFAGLRTDVAGDFSSSASATVVITNLPSLSQATTALAINDETFNNQNSLAITIIGGMLRVEQFEDGVVNVLAMQGFEPGNVPLTLEISIVDAQVIFSASGPAIDEELFSTAAPAWFSDAYVSVNVGNPTKLDPGGVPRFDRIEACSEP